MVLFNFWLAGQSPCGTRQPIFVGGHATQGKGLVFLEGVLYPICGHRMGVWWGYLKQNSSNASNISPDLGMAWGFGGSLVGAGWVLVVVS